MLTEAMPHEDPPVPQRRFVLQLLSGLGLLGLGGAFKTARAAEPAATWPKDAFSSKSQPDALKALYGKTTEVSDKISLDVS